MVARLNGWAKTSLVARNIECSGVERALSQERLASDAQVERSYLGSLERVLENPTVATLDRLVAVLSVPLAQLLHPRMRKR
jgi:transcriptional regulator with XRE-family HTH domain